MHIVFLIFLVGCNLASTEKKVAQLEEVRSGLYGRRSAVSSQPDGHERLTDGLLRCVQNVVIWQNMDSDQKKFLKFACHCLKLELV